MFMNYEFEALPLVEIDGHEAFYVDGTAHIDPHDDDFEITGISFTGWRYLGAGKPRSVKPVSLPADNPLFQIIESALRRRSSDQIIELLGDCMAEA